MEQHQIDEDQEHQRRRAGWSRRCPFCRADVLHADRAGVMACGGCSARLAPPSDRDLEPRLPGEQGMPRWDGDERLLAKWDRYSRSGMLLEEWGSSTHREDGAPPRERDGGEEEHPPRVRYQAQRGRQDDLLDAQIRAYVDQTQALRDAIDEVKIAVQRAGRAKAATQKRTGARGPTCAEVLLNHLGELDGGVPPQRRSRHGAPGWFAALSAACCGALRSQVNALVILAVNALRRRGVEYLDSLDLVSPKVEREEPFANARHALAVALSGGGTIGGSAPKLGGAQAKHTTPSGMVLGKIAIAPSHSSSGRAPGEDGVIEALDARSALRSVRVGRRFESRDGVQVEVDPGRPLDEVELELLELVDRGEVKPRAKTNGKGRVIQEAIEPVAIRDAAGRLSTKTTEKEARQALARSRRGLEEALRERGLIPEPRPRQGRTKTPDPRLSPLGPTMLPSHIREVSP